MALESFPERLKKFRRNHGLTQAGLAHRLHFSAATISSWERGIRRPDIQQIPRLAETLIIDTDELIESINAMSLKFEEATEREVDFKGLTQTNSIITFVNQENCELYMRKASLHARKIKILTIRGEKYFGGSKALLYHLCEPSKRARDAIIEVLVLSPEAHHVTEELAQKLQHDSVEEIKGKMKLSLDRLKFLNRQNNNFSVKCYHGKPIFKILLFDDVMFVSSFAIEQPKNDQAAEMFMIHDGNSLFAGFERLFDELSKHSTTPD